ncbi:MAG: hypothetical protein NW237_01355 [Cyanobacteriota bacterium]|nr:hypothetical protein [Cyanobacteriota bacterium]
MITLLTHWGRSFGLFWLPCAVSNAVNLMHAIQRQGSTSLILLLG